MFSVIRIALIAIVTFIIGSSYANAAESKAFNLGHGSSMTITKHDDGPELFWTINLHVRDYSRIAEDAAKDIDLYYGGVKLSDLTHKVSDNFVSVRGKISPEEVAALIMAMKHGTPETIGYFYVYEGETPLEYIPGVIDTDEAVDSLTKMLLCIK